MRVKQAALLIATLILAYAAVALVAPSRPGTALLDEPMPSPASSPVAEGTAGEPTLVPTSSPAPTSSSPTRTTPPSPTIPPTEVPTTAATGGPHLDPNWDHAIRTEDGGTIGRVTADLLNIRVAPRLSAASVGATFKKHPIVVYDTVEGDAVAGVPVWYRVGPDRFVAAAYVEPFVATPPRSSYAGRWIDINLSTFYATAYVDDRPVYVAIIIAGQEREGNRTPEGEFQIFRRVANETMDATTLGIKKTDPDYYYLPNVKWTQYFAPEGVALHTNYWSDPWAFGGRASHGCVNLLEKDAEFFWRFATIGSPVSVHY